MGKLRQVDVLVGQGESVGEAVKSIGVTETTHHRWCKEYGCLKLSQARRLKELERENVQLKGLVAELTLASHILKGQAGTGD